MGGASATELAPERFRTQMVAQFLLSGALGPSASGLPATYSDPKNEMPCFLVLGLVAVAGGVVLLAVARPSWRGCGESGEPACVRVRGGAASVVRR